MNYKDIPLAALAEMRADAKYQEDKAIAYRRDLDAEIAIRLKDRNEGTVSASEGGYKITVQYKLTRKVNTDAVTKAWPDLSENAQKAFKWSAALDTKQFRAIEALNSAELKEIAPLITTTPASPSVEVELVTKE